MLYTKSFQRIPDKQQQRWLIVAAKDDTGTAEIDNVIDNSLGRKLVHTSGLAKHHMHEQAPRAAAVSHNNADCMTALLLTELAHLEEALLGKACIVHVDH